MTSLMTSHTHTHTKSYFITTTSISTGFIFSLSLPLTSPYLSLPIHLSFLTFSLFQILTPAFPRLLALSSPFLALASQEAQAAIALKGLHSEVRFEQTIRKVSRLTTM